MLGKLPYFELSLTEWLYEFRSVYLSMCPFVYPSIRLSIYNTLFCESAHIIFLILSMKSEPLELKIDSLIFGADPDFLENLQFS